LVGRHFDKEAPVFTRRIFDGVIVTMLAFHLAAGIPRMWARRVVRSGDSPNWQKVVGSATLQATS
jgi:hypothetical protein